MRFSTVLIAFMISCCIVASSCSRPRRPAIVDKVPLTTVRGTILVDDAPAVGVQIQYVPQGEIAEHRERYINRFFVTSGEGGKFSLSTYVNGDGVPHGEYILEFKWFEQRLSGEFDKLRGKYSNPDLPFLKIQVGKGSVIDLGEIRLSTKPSEKIN